MVNLAAVELGNIIGSNIKSANDYRETFIETEDVADINIVGISSVNIVGSYFIYSTTLDGSTFVWNHPLQGIWGSNYFGASAIASSSLVSSGTL